MRIGRANLGGLGRNGQLDLYVTLVISFGVGVLGVFDVVSVTVLAGATLAAVGLVAIVALNARTQMASMTTAATELVESTRRYVDAAVSADRLLRISTSGLDLDLRSAADVRIVGVTLSRTIRTHLSALQRCVAGGGTVRVAVIEPDRRVIDEAARRSTAPESAAVFGNRLRATLDLLQRLAATGGAGRIEIRVLGFVPAFGLFIVDPAEADGRILVDIYSHRFAGEEPSIPIRAGLDHHWYRHFLAEFDRMWAGGRPVELSAAGTDLPVEK